ncbi:C-X-C chemokine receptor type 3-like [Nerophis ophidion]|uniref:C-X-C chemokine receptor type 3-like n=1 Tax=Nerophis ophidion TaxID=159077 RepID=UPI002AE00355|nr:C-X-C chemokine receptor type 3-like [Nerophis ophidion]XP_061771046.1 C-X-C chemokine receptor type 3-like [Nerophis ophidion]XP_061771047.1 C-X-C chemokine receptor type 3-like [Nerophis ophidion]
MDVNLDGLFRLNSSYDYGDDYVYTDDDPESRRARAVWIPLVYSVVLVAGLLGNGLLLAFLAQKKRAWRTSDTFVLHLSVADLLLLVTLPLWAAQASQSCGWCVGLALCKISGVLFKLNFFCGVFLLAAICLDRYLFWVHATPLFSRRKPRMTHLSCALAWASSLLLTLPDWLFLALEPHPWKEEWTQCVPSLYPAHTRLASRLPQHLFGAAAAAVVCCSCLLPWLRRPPLSLRDQRAAITTLILAGVFCFCWLPYNVTLAVDTFGSSATKTSLMATAALGCVHACLRPPLYFAVSAAFRTWTLAALSCAKVEPKGSAWGLGVGEDAVPERNPEEEAELKQVANGEQQELSKVSSGDS